MKTRPDSAVFAAHVWKKIQENSLRSRGLFPRSRKNRTHKIIRICRQVRSSRATVMKITDL